MISTPTLTIMPRNALALLVVFVPFLLCSRAPLQAAPKTSSPSTLPHTLSGGQDVFVASPDRLYEARLTGGDAVPSYVYIYRVLRGRRRLVRPKIVDARGFVWVPKHPHLLVVAAGGGTEDFQGAQLASWDDGKQLRELVPVKDRGSEGFELEGVTADGKTLVYAHNTGEDVLVHLRLRLPSR